MHAKTWFECANCCTPRLSDIDREILKARLANYMEIDRINSFDTEFLRKKNATSKIERKLIRDIRLEIYIHYYTLGLIDSNYSLDVNFTLILKLSAIT